MYNVLEIASRGLLFTTDTIPGCVTNLYLIKGKNVNYLIDTGLGSDTARYVKEYIGPGDVIVINTHYHWDHVWGNVGFEGRQIVAHRKAFDLIGQQWDEMEARNGKWKEGAIRKVLPNTLIEDRLAFPDDGVEVFYSPGHTVDSVSVYDHIDKVLHVGDNIETLMPGIHDDRGNCIRSLKKYLELDFSHCISGHNGDVKRDDVETVLGMLTAGDR